MNFSKLQLVAAVQQVAVVYAQTSAHATAAGQNRQMASQQPARGRAAGNSHIVCAEEDVVLHPVEPVDVAAAVVAVPQIEQGRKAKCQLSPALPAKLADDILQQQLQGA